MKWLVFAGCLAAAACTPKATVHEPVPAVFVIPAATPATVYFSAPGPVRQVADKALWDLKYAKGVSEKHSKGN
jgi:hypothetical protein